MKKIILISLITTCLFLISTVRIIKWEQCGWFDFEYKCSNWGVVDSGDNFININKIKGKTYNNVFYDKELTHKLLEKKYFLIMKLPIN